jgi:adenylate kinase family enzyme
LGVLFLECPEEICTKRILSRSSTSGRVDDNEISLKKRFSVFTAETLPTIEELRSFTQIINIKSDRSMDVVFTDTCIEFDKILSNV